MKHIDAALLKAMYISGSNNLYNHYPEVDQLNVFPVPDGDTGMNMNLTVTSGMKEIQNKSSGASINEIANAFSRGLLMGARGNSGVITSQIFRGFAQGIEGKAKIDAKTLADAFTKAKEVAYKAVMKPVEGTILTVIRESSEALAKYVKPSTSIEDAFSYLLEQAQLSLAHTPDLLPVLKEVGVVDSGGAGLCRLLEGMNEVLQGRFVDRVGELDKEGEAPVPLYAGAKLTEDEEGYGYCTQFILRLASSSEAKKPFIEKNFTMFLQRHGKSVVIVRDEDIVKVHVHTLTPGNMLNYAQQFGEFVTITIENMSEEHHNIEQGNKATEYDLGHREEKKEEEIKEGSAGLTISPDSGKEKEYGLIAVSSGKGIDEMFLECGSDVIVSGGQTMNPSTSDFLEAAKAIKANNLFILPNNSNIILAASQAAEVLNEEGKNVIVIPSKTIPQGLAAAMMYNPDFASDSMEKDMNDALKRIRSGSVTYAIKDTDIAGVHVTKGFYLAMRSKNIVSCVRDKKEALLDLVDALVRKSTSLVTIYCGNDVSEEEMESLQGELSEKYSEDVEVLLQRGDQPVYSFLVGAE